jgi:hypothetical protein
MWTGPRFVSRRDRGNLRIVSVGPLLRVEPDCHALDRRQLRSVARAQMPKVGFVEQVVQDAVHGAERLAYLDGDVAGRSALLAHGSHDFTAVCGGSATRRDVDAIS